MRKKVSNNLHIPLPLLKMSHMTRMLQLDPLRDVGDAVVEGLNGDVGGCIVSSVDE